MGFNFEDSQLLRRLHADGDQVANPARGMLFTRGYELQGSAVCEGFAIQGIGNHHCGVVHIGGDFAQRVHHLVAIAPFGYQVKAELLSARLLGYAQRLEQVDQVHTGVGLVGLGVLVVNGDRLMGQRSRKLGGSPLRRTFLPRLIFSGPAGDPWLSRIDSTAGPHPRRLPGLEGTHGIGWPGGWFEVCA